MACNGCIHVRSTSLRELRFSWASRFENWATNKCKVEECVLRPTVPSGPLEEAPFPSSQAGLPAMPPPFSTSISARALYPPTCHYPWFLLSRLLAQQKTNIKDNFACHKSHYQRATMQWLATMLRFKSWRRQCMALRCIVWVQSQLIQELGEWGASANENLSNSALTSHLPTPKM